MSETFWLRWTSITRAMYRRWSEQNNRAFMQTQELIHGLKNINSLTGTGPLKMLNDAIKNC